MRTWLISDSHGNEQGLKIPEGIDMVVFAGDAGTVYNPVMNIRSVKDFISWFEGLKIKHKVWIAGNHCTSIEAGLVRPKELCNTTTYLEHESAVVGGIKIFGSPYSPRFYDWAFNVDRDKLHKYWADIPMGTDLLITHSPPYGIMDVGIYDGQHLGCEVLAARIKVVKPKYVVFGHIHSNSGVKVIDGITYINAAVLDDDYKLVNNGFVLDINV